MWMVHLTKRLRFYPKNRLQHNFLLGFDVDASHSQKKTGVVCGRGVTSKLFRWWR